MEKEARLIRLRANEALEIEWDVIESAGNAVMTDVVNGRSAERGFALTGQIVENGRGEIVRRVTGVIGLGLGTQNTFTISPELSRRLAAHPLEEGTQVLGLSHSHPPGLQSHASSADLRYMAHIPDKVGMIIQADEDGGGRIHVHDHTGTIAYSIVGRNGERQAFAADRGRGMVDVARLKSDRIPPSPVELAA